MAGPLGHGVDMQNGQWRVAVVVGCGLVAAEAGAQAFNIDIAPGTQLPSAAYGAASGQVGQWTRGLKLGSALKDINGNATGASFGGSGTQTSLSGVPTGNPDEHEMMSSAYLMDSGSGSSVGVLGLSLGWYDVYVYCWTGAGFSNPTISVGADSGSFVFHPNSTAPWPGQQVANITFVKATLQVQQAGTGIGVSYGLGGNNFAAVSGMQIVPVPAPGAMVLPLAALLGSRRRR